MMAAYPTQYVPMTTIGYPISTKNDEIHVVLIENGSFYNKVCTKPIEILEGNHSNGFKSILISFNAKFFIVINLDAKVLVNLISKTPFHIIVAIKLIPPNLGGNPPKPLRGVTVAFIQHVVPYSRPFRRPLNYLEYKKDSNPNVHVQIFKVVIKTTDELVNEEIANLFNFTLRNNTFDWCNNYMRDNPKCRFTYLEKVLYLYVIGLCRMMNMYIYS
jgi:hypothetical protein